MEKQCSRCHQVKPTSEFHRDKGKRDGLKSMCKACACERLNKWRKSETGQASTKASTQRRIHSEKWQEYRRRYRQRQDVREKERKYALQRYYEKRDNPDFVEYMQSERRKAVVKRYMSSPEGRRVTRKAKQHPHRRANRAIRYAIERGDIPSASTLVCTKCGAPAQHYHHHNGYDLNHWLDVIPLCVPCHGRAHRKR